LKRNLIRICLTIDQFTLNLIDDVVRRGIYPNRSHAVRSIIRSYFNSIYKAWEVGREEGGEE